jgi:hypothetical protein
MDKDLLLQDKERKYNELEQQLCRRADVNTKQLSNHIQADIRLKSRQMKAMAGELNMNQLQVCNTLLHFTAFLLHQINTSYS